ncbi:MAG: sulfatase [Pseudomonadota bacterium]|nr:sulfatase [Pseudomonadota bacterium]
MVRSLAERPHPRSPAGDTPIEGALVDGALVGLVLWALECGAIAALNAGVGGLSVLRALADDLAAWGLAYLLFGAAAGLLARTRAGPWGAGLPWLVLVALADPAVAPRAVYGVLVVVAVGAVWALRGRAAGLRRGIVVVVPLALVSLAVRVPEAPPLAGVAGPGPNVVLLVVDTLRRDHVGAYGYARDTTPHLDALAGQGVRFSRAWSTSSWTLPAHASLFTGLHPSVHGAIEAHPRLELGPATLAGALDRRGYRTVGLSANAWVSGGTGLDRGFERFAFLGDQGLVSQLLLPLCFARPPDLGGRALTKAATAAIEEAANAGEPLFLFVNYLEAHEPLGSLPEEALSRFSPTPLDPTLGRAWLRDMPRSWSRCTDGSVGELRCRDGLYRASPDRVRGVVDRYDAGIAYVDARIGEVWAAVERAGLDDDTLFVVTSDHGEHVGEDGRLGHMVWLDDALLEIPLVARFPRRFGPGTVDDTPVDLAWLHDWILASVDGAEPPRAPDPRAEVHPHAPTTIASWEALYGDDFGPAATLRRAVTNGAESVRRDGERVTTNAGAQATNEDIAWVDGGADSPTPASDAPIDPATLRALEALGYVR